ncbi:MAG: hypothetical protein M3R58_02520 [Pseudomonadota bacterium]|nr:hypothetical protein [Pseudomonadota bacterium]
MEAVRKPRLRVGVFSDSPHQSRWIADALARAGAGDFAEIALVAIRPHPGASKVPLLWRAYRRCDRALFGSRSNWSGTRDLNSLVAPERRVEMGEDERCWKARIRDARLDVAFALGQMDDGVLEGAARYGTWRFCFGEDQGTFEPMAGVREAIDAKPVVASGIRIHPGAGKPDRIAYQSWGRAFPFSVTRSRDALFAKTVDFVARTLRDLHAGGAKWVEMGTEPARDLPADTFPGVAGLIRDITTMGKRVAQRAAEKALTVDTWSIAYRFGAAAEWTGSLEGFFRLSPPNGWYWADPFPIQVAGRNYIFFEELPLGASKAHISVVEVDREGNASTPVKVLERDYHLSYPFLVEEGGTLYMIPETAHNNTVEIYRCVEFPAKWQLERVLMKDVRCADATLTRLGDRWWMFANGAAQGEEINDELFLFSSATLLGEWRPHRRNPVKSDVRSSRPAGHLFWSGNRLYRPGQICAPLYGSGIALHRVTRLTEDEFAEEEESQIVPREPDTLGIHTLNRAGDLTVTDAFERRPRF